jgi:hypothetical protein
MLDEPQLLTHIDDDTRRLERREFFRACGATAAFVGGLALMASPSPLEAQTAPSDADVFNFALNLEYLEATFYSRAVFGSDLDAAQTTGQGTQGTVNLTGARQVTFSDPVVARLAREIATNERLHVQFVRETLGTAAIARPALDLSVSPTSAFSLAARSAGLIGPNDAFDPYASEENFLLAGYLFEDVGVTAYKGASPLITNKTFLEAAAGILAVEGYHASILRTTLFFKGLQTPALITATEAISNARDTLDGPADLDQGVAVVDNASNIVPTDPNGITFSRSAAQVLNIGYLTRASVTQGGFFPSGVNGAIRTSANNA